MLNFEKYRFSDNVTPLNADTFNSIFLDVDSRIGQVESILPSLNTAISQLVQVGLDRINTALLPAFQLITEIQTLGFLSSPIQSGTSVPFIVSPSTAVVIDANHKSLFIPPPWVVLVRQANATDYCIAQVLSYIPATGGLTLNITSTHGNPGTLDKSATITLGLGSPGTVNWTAHGFSVGKQVSFTTTGALLTGLSPGVVYYVVTNGLATNSFEVSATFNGAPINFTGTQSGVHTGSAWTPFTDVYVEGCPGGALAAIDANAAVASALASINASLATVISDTATCEADRVLIQGVVLAGPVTSVNGLTGAVVGIEQLSHKGAVSGYASLDSASHVPAVQLPIGLANGVLGLDGSGKALTSQLPAVVLNCLQFKGSWNAGANSPALASGLGTTGSIYKVSVGGNTNLDGNSVWNVGDLAFFDGIVWDRVNAPITWATVQQGTGIGQGANIVKIGWTGSLLKVTVDATDLGSLWNDYSILNAPAGFRTVLGAEPAATANAINLQVSNYTLVLADAGKIIEMNSASANTLTIPPNSSVAFSSSPPTRIDVVQVGAGITTIAAGAGVTIRSAGNLLKLAGQWSAASLYQRNANEWVLFGSLTS